MVSRTSQHALRAVLYLARRWSEGPVPVDTIAAALGAPRNYLSKTLNALTKAGVLRSARGPMGGFTLAVPPQSHSCSWAPLALFQSFTSTHLFDETFTRSPAAAPVRES